MATLEVGCGSGLLVGVGIMFIATFVMLIEMREIRWMRWSWTNGTILWMIT